MDEARERAVVGRASNLMASARALSHSSHRREDWLQAFLLNMISSYSTQLLQIDEESLLLDAIRRLPFAVVAIRLGAPRADDDEQLRRALERVELAAAGEARPLAIGPKKEDL